MNKNNRCKAKIEINRNLPVKSIKMCELMPGEIATICGGIGSVDNQFRGIIKGTVVMRDFQETRRKSIIMNMSDTYTDTSTWRYEDLEDEICNHLLVTPCPDAVISIYLDKGKQ